MSSSRTSRIRSGLALGDDDLLSFRELMAGRSRPSRGSTSWSSRSLPSTTRARPATGRRPRRILQRLVLEDRDQGRADGRAGGQAVAIKDNICVAGVPMMNGSRLLEGYVPEIDATVVTRILEAGGTIAGKAACEDLCFSGGSHTCATGPIRNPHNPTHSAGGSSGGSAALVAAGDVDDGARRRPGRLDPHAVELVRRLRPEADLGAGADDGRRCRSPIRSTIAARCALDRGRGAAADRDRRARRLDPRTSVARTGRLHGARSGKGAAGLAHRRAEGGLRPSRERSRGRPQGPAPPSTRSTAPGADGRARSRSRCTTTGRTSGRGIILEGAAEMMLKGYGVGNNWPATIRSRCRRRSRAAGARASTMSRRP